MSTVRRSDLVSQLAGKSIDKESASQDPRLRGLNVAAADLDGDGSIRTPAELDRLFTEMDRFDRDGNRNSVRVADVNGGPTQVAAMIDAVRALARPDPITGPTPAPSAPSPSPSPLPSAGSLTDAALKNAFGASAPSVPAAALTREQAVAVQYALGRLGTLDSPVDGAFGPASRRALSEFQRQNGLPATGAVDAVTLATLDRKVSQVDPRSPAARAADPLAYLSDYEARGVSKIAIADRSRAVDWKHPEVEKAYGKFVGEYWQVLKENHVECDCKTLSLFFMDRFRQKVKQDTGVQLPLPSSNRGRVPAADWVVSTGAKPAGYFSRFEALPQIRPGYDAATSIQRLDPKHSMIYGVNVRYPNVDANMVSRAIGVAVPWSAPLENGGDRTRAELPVSQMRPGDVIFIDHTGDGRNDHVVNVVGVERDAQNRVRKLTLATGSFDDMKDANGATAPRGTHEVNNYTEEIQIQLDEQGRIQSDKVTWSSEPSYVHDSRYSARTTLMELKQGGRLFIGRWGG